MIDLNPLSPADRQRAQQIIDRLNAREPLINRARVLGEHGRRLYDHLRDLQELVDIVGPADLRGRIKSLFRDIEDWLSWGRDRDTSDDTPTPYPLRGEPAP